jgi:hypothetical protein
MTKAHAAGGSMAPMKVAKTKPAAPRLLQTRALAAGFLALSFLISIAFLSVRNIYDDEYSSLDYVNLSPHRIIVLANSGDVHPPGMYLLAHFAYQAIPSPRWMTLPELLVLYTGLCLFVLAVAPLFLDIVSVVCFLLLATLSPQLLMWGNTIRWYGWWTGLALTALVVSLQPNRQPEQLRLTSSRAAGLGVLVALLFYLNYITLIFGIALAVAMLFRYGRSAWRQYLVLIALSFVLIFPQIHYFLTVHIPGGQGQRSGILVSLARLVEATFCSEAYLPWNPLAVVALILFIATAVAGTFSLLREIRTEGIAELFQRNWDGIYSAVIFFLIFFVLVAISGLGVKPRNGLLLVPLLAVPTALVVGSWHSKAVQKTVIVLFALWCGGGAEHLVRREGLAKANMNNRPEEVASLLRSAPEGDCATVVTYDPLLALTLSTSHLHHLLILAPWRNAIYLHSQPFSTDGCGTLDVYWVRSYLGGFGEAGKVVGDEMQAARATLSGASEVRQLSPDPDAARKRKLTFLSGASDLPDYRYIVERTSIPAAELGLLEQRLPHFAVMDGTSAPRETFSSTPAAP